MANPRPLILTDAAYAYGDPEPVSISGLGTAAEADVEDFVETADAGTIISADIAAFVAVDDTPADAAAVAADLIAVRAALIAAGLMEAS